MCVSQIRAESRSFRLRICPKRHGKHGNSLDPMNPESFLNVADYARAARGSLIGKLPLKFATDNKSAEIHQFPLTSPIF
jgi:hypothetical protein